MALPSGWRWNCIHDSIPAISNTVQASFSAGRPQVTSSRSCDTRAHISHTHEQPTASGRVCKPPASSPRASCMTSMQTKAPLASCLPHHTPLPAKIPAKTQIDTLHQPQHAQLHVGQVSGRAQVVAQTPRPSTTHAQQRLPCHASNRSSAPRPHGETPPPSQPIGTSYLVILNCFTRLRRAAAFLSFVKWSRTGCRMPLSAVVMPGLRSPGCSAPER